MKLSGSLEDYERAYVTEQLHDKGFNETNGLSYRELVHELVKIKNREGEKGE